MNLTNFLLYELYKLLTLQTFNFKSYFCQKLKTMGKLIFILLKALSYLPFMVLYAFADFLFVINYYIIGYRKKVVMDNLNIAFPEKSLKEKKKISRLFFRNFSDFIVESIKTFSMSHESFKKRYHFLNIKEFNAFAIKENKGAVIFASHQFNWEWMINVSSHFPENIKAYISYTPLSNKTLNHLIIKNRERFGLRLASAKDFVKTIQNSDKEELSISGLISDQSPKANYKFRTQFFGKDVPAYTGAENIAKKFDQSYWFLNVTKIKRGYYEVQFDLMEADVSSFQEGELTRRSIARTEDLIRKQPENYLWTHRRWKHAR